MNLMQVVKLEIPGRQCLWKITLRSLQHLGTYWSHHLPPDIPETFFKTVDRAVADITILTTQLDTHELSEKTKEITRLPVRFKGCGLHILKDHRHAK